MVDSVETPILAEPDARFSERKDDIRAEAQSRQLHEVGRGIAKQ